MIRILIADDHAIVRAGLKQFIADQADMEVTAEASSGSEAIADGVSGDADRPLHAELSQREFQIFCKLAAGAAVSKIADELNLSVKTVSTYRTRILEKMAMKSNADLTYYAIKNGLIE